VVEEDSATLTVRVGTPLDDIERRVTMATLAQCGNVKRRAAEILGISVKTLYNRLEAYAASDSAAREVVGTNGVQQEAQ
jgi:DNA-binding NtrC family response regulator